MTREYHILSLGAGVQSTTLFLMMRDGTIKTPENTVAIFADTQEEPCDVYTHLEWLKSLEWPRILVRTVGKLGDDLQRGRNHWGQRHHASIPAFTLTPGSGQLGKVRRQCTREYKIDVVERAIRRDVLGLKPRQRIPRDAIVHQYVGISTDEARRAIRVRERIEANAQCRAHFPLLEMNWTRADCQTYLQQYVPHEVPRSACVFCPFKRDAEWQRLKEAGGPDWDRAVEIDHALRDPALNAGNGMHRRLFLHASCKPLELVDFKAQQQFSGFVEECEGMCGV